MAGIIVIGAQWGDEGKGKVTDWLANEMDFVVRYQGGHNAGHTVVHDGKELRLHLLPSGVLYSNITSVIGNGLVVDPKALLDELSDLERAGVGRPKLVLSSNAHLIMPYHKMIDEATEVRLGKAKIGTTGRGIGPAYADKAARIGLRVQDLLDMKIFREKLATALDRKRADFDFYEIEEPGLDEIADEYAAYADKINGMIGDTEHLLNWALKEGKNVLFEGAQGTMLDLDHGTYPFVTSSSPTAGGACVGTGVSPLRIDRIIGIAKAYTTRVGYGPFPTEDTGESGETLQCVGAEFGTTTGRTRRCGWLDGVVLKYAVEINGMTEIALTKLDVLSPFSTVRICVGYEFGGEVFDHMPPHQTIFHKCTPVYEELSGWQVDLGGITKYSGLPEATRRYVERIEEIAGVPINLISVGPSRTQTIIK
ncbi:MAG: adenylosuccinate synthase [Actinobacteria bacterium]|nr:adenylosuccinate synthase [Actinomycetota bacterium]